MSKITANGRKIKEKLTADGKDVVSLNLSCPFFGGEESAAINKLNEYYGQGMDKFYEFCKKRFSAVSENSADDKKKKLPGISMSWTVPYMGDNYLSVITDITYFNGREKVTKRFSDNWGIRKFMPLRAKHLFDNSSSAKKYICGIIAGKISDREGGFNYRKNADVLAQKHFNAEKFYITSKGIAFFYEKNLLFESTCLYPAFVIPYDKMKGLKFSAGCTESNSKSP